MNGPLEVLHKSASFNNLIAGIKQSLSRANSARNSTSSLHKLDDKPSVAPTAEQRRLASQPHSLSKMATSFSSNDDSEKSKTIQEPHRLSKSESSSAVKRSPSNYNPVIAPWVEFEPGQDTSKPPVKEEKPVIETPRSSVTKPKLKEKPPMEKKVSSPSESSSLLPNINEGKSLQVI
jgi:hypothetical protein